MIPTYSIVYDDELNMYLIYASDREGNVAAFYSRGPAEQFLRAVRGRSSEDALRTRYGKRPMGGS